MRSSMKAQKSCQNLPLMILLWKENVSNITQKQLQNFIVIFFFTFVGIYDTRSEIEVSLKMTRLFKYHLSQGFFQSFLLGFLSYLTFWIDIQKFNDRFMGSLTALLVLTSLMSTINGNLPKASYFKMIDIWLFYFICCTALNIGIHILIDQCYRREVYRKYCYKVSYFG